MAASRIVDVLTDLLQRSRARGAAFSLSTMHGEWGLRFPTEARLAIHAVLGGEPHVWLGDAPAARRLGPGDVVLVRGGGDACQLASSRTAPCVSWRAFAASAGSWAGDGARRFGQGEPDGTPPARFLCGAYLFEGDLVASVLEGLPMLSVLRPSAGSALRTTVDLLAAEMGRDAPGQQALLDRLLDVVLVQALREHLSGAGAAAPGWYHALGDAPIATALHAIHEAPEQAWTVASLAAEAALSRAAFARRFTELLGEPPLAYLTSWRMALARERLRDTSDGLALIAADVGYASEFSFAAAFKRHEGLAPGRWRAQARQAVAA